MNNAAIRGWHNECASGRFSVKHALSLLNK